MFFYKTIRQWFVGSDPQKDMYVFHYYDGTKWRSADPLVIDRVFVDRMGENWRKKIVSMATPIPKGAIGADATRAKEEKRKLDDELLETINEAFDVKPFKDGEGLTVVQRRVLLAEFNWFCVALLEASRPFVMPQSRASPSPEDQPLSSGAVSS